MRVSGSSFGSHAPPPIRVGLSLSQDVPSRPSTAARRKTHNFGSCKFPESIAREFDSGRAMCANFCRQTMKRRMKSLLADTRQRVTVVADSFSMAG